MSEPLVSNCNECGCLIDLEQDKDGICYDCKELKKEKK